MTPSINIPEGFHRVTPYLVLKDPQAAIDFLSKTVDAVVSMKPMYREDGGFMHGEIRIGDSIMMLGGALDDWPPMPGMFYVYVADADATYQKAIAAGGTSIMEPADQPHGDRYGMVSDPQGNQWCFAQAKEILSEQAVREQYGQAD
jgi:uncharacterized glyoxalase superfamily protein PhnB